MNNAEKTKDIWMVMRETDSGNVFVCDKTTADEEYTVTNNPSLAKCFHTIGDAMREAIHYNEQYHNREYPFRLLRVDQ